MDYKLNNYLVLKDYSVQGDIIKSTIKKTFIGKIQFLKEINKISKFLVVKKIKFKIKRPIALMNKSA